MIPVASASPIDLAKGTNAIDSVITNIPWTPMPQIATIILLDSNVNLHHYCCLDLQYLVRLRHSCFLPYCYVRIGNGTYHIIRTRRTTAVPGMYVPGTY